MCRTVPYQTPCRTLDFVGYGPERPRYVFVGIEEYLIGDEHINIDTRCRLFHPHQDRDDALRAFSAAYRAAGSLGDAQTYLDAATPGQVPVWIFLAQLTAALRAQSPCEDGGPWSTATVWEVEYMHLGSRVGDTLLADLFPLPKRGLQDWPSRYTTDFGYPNYGAWYRHYWPRSGQQCARRTLLEGQLQPSALSPDYVIEFGRGAGGEFWQRFDQLLSLAPSTLNETSSQVWHQVAANRIEVGRTVLGTRVARLGFPNGQSAKQRVTVKDIPMIVENIRSVV